MQMKQKSCVAIVARGEEQYIQECICYNYILGWDAIVVVVHRDPTDNQPDRTEELINNLPGHILEKVIVIPFEYSPENYAPNYQNKAYQELIYPLVKDKFEWMAMFDADEYFYDSKKRKINEILDLVPSDAGQVVLTSLIYGHNNQILSAPPTKTRLRWFNKRTGKINHKSIVRIDSIINTQEWYCRNFAKVHGKSVNFDWKVVFDQIDNWDDVWASINNGSCNADDPCLIHYESGAMEDWVNRQYNRNKYYIENKPDYDRFVNHFAGKIKDDRMLIYTNELDSFIRQCDIDLLKTMSDEEFVTLKYNRNTPVLFLIFNKPDATRQVFSRIRKAKPLKLYIVHDGDLYQEKESLCREIIASVDWDCEVFNLPVDKYAQYDQVVKQAINWFFDNEPEGIILEDNCLPADSFFGFCSVMLERYRNNERVGHISGSNFQKGRSRGDGDYYFSSLTHNVWGWAGWRRVWKDIHLETEYRHKPEMIE